MSSVSAEASKSAEPKGEDRFGLAHLCDLKPTELVPAIRECYQGALFAYGESICDEFCLALLGLGLNLVMEEVVRAMAETEVIYFASPRAARREMFHAPRNQRPLGVGSGTD